MKYLILLFLAFSALADDSVYVNQIGTGNTVSISQSGSAQSVNITTGSTSSVDTSSYSVTQQGTGTMSASINIPSGYSNTVSISQYDTGNQTTAIQNLNGATNNITINQSGASNNTFNLIGGAGTNNSANTITATQSGGIGADKSFTLNMNGTNGATVTIQQTNTTTPDTGSMSINCTVGTCGKYSYIKN